MKSIARLIAILVALSVLHQCAVADDSPSDLIIGKWRDRSEPNDAVIQFLKGGTGSITEMTPKKTTQANISWKVTDTYGNACVVVVKYEEPKPKEAKPLPKEAKPFTWLIAFDGSDTFVMQPNQNRISFMDRQKPPPKVDGKKAR